MSLAPNLAKTNLNRPGADIYDGTRDEFSEPCKKCGKKGAIPAAAKES